ncbi:MAG TPA: hypothetical protein VET87_14790 [Rubrivivax sp.]|jgi:hypothetical protein|nr:hypothetical protein [Rubrivivax sp.]
MKTIPLIVRLRGLLARNRDEFWWNYFTDEELELRKMDVWELAGVIQDARVTSGMDKKLIVAEHMLNVRLAQIQATASWGSGVLGFIGALVGAALSVVLAAALQGEPKLERSAAQYSLPVPAAGAASTAPGAPPVKAVKPSAAQPPIPAGSSAVQR